MSSLITRVLMVSTLAANACEVEQYADVGGA